MWILGVTLAGFIVLFFFYRSFPVPHVKCMDLTNGEVQQHMAVVDTRDYQLSCQDGYDRAYCLPLSYLKRYVYEIPDQPIVLICSDSTERNLAARFLRRKGYEVVGYTLTEGSEECPCVPCIADK
ncbi:rhodanese-like domain-containing protein [Halobacillus litoralis]|uniref:rhodanese-like domain-containing protein n=1 Tax=Halobacillus litoralis TaxID=45668 RepID=UPI001CFEE789|nr:rhodanese-like domain-containing protein [Halobacillus litoralis]